MGARPLPAGAQPPPPLVAYIGGPSREQSADRIASFLDEMRKLGYAEGQDFRFEQRYADGHYERIPALAREIAALRPDAVLASGAAVDALHKATSAIPVVFVLLGDAGAQALVPDFAHPGGNFTGFTGNELALVTKRLGLLQEIAPRVATVLFIRGDAVTTLLVSSLKEAASRFGIAVTDGVGTTSSDIENAVAQFARQPNGGIIVDNDFFAVANRDEIIQSAARHSLPAIYPFSVFADAGGLLSYGYEPMTQYRQAASYVIRILKGEKPGDLPVQLPTTFTFVLNLKTAKALGLSVSPTLLALADQVIE